MRQTILIFGEAGCNVGDDAILHVICTKIRRIAPDCKLIVASSSPERAPDVRAAEVVSTLNQLETFYLGRSWLSRQIPALYRTMRALRRANAIIVGGGGLATDLHGIPFFAKWVWAALIGKILDKPVIALGIGAGPYRTKAGRMLARFLGSFCREISVRDKYSYDALITAGVPPERITVTAEKLSRR